MEEEIIEIIKNLTPEIMKDLTPREQKVLKMRFGIYGEEYHTLGEVGKKFNITRERVRQIQQRAIEKIKEHNLWKNNLTSKK